MALHIFVVRDLMADWGWGFTCPQTLPNPLLSRAKCNFQLANANKLTRQYIPKGTDFSTISSAFIRKIQYKINRRPRKKLNFDCQRMFSSGKSLILHLPVENRIFENEIYNRNFHVFIFDLFM